MIYKRCPRCGKRIQEGTKCLECTRKIRATSNRTDGIRKEYHTSRWEKEREWCLARHGYVDLYALYHDGRIKAADRVHHICEVLEEPERFHDPENHFPCSDASHHEIHRRYKSEGPEKIQKELRDYLRRWENEQKNEP